MPPKPELLPLTPDPYAPGLLTRLSRPPRKVMLLRASRIGDFVCATPAFRALRYALPQAEITLIAMPFIEELAARSPHIDRFVAFPGFPGMAEQFFDARQAIAFFQQMQDEQFDLAVQMHGSGVYSNPFTLMLGAQLTAGFVRSGDPPGRLDAALPMPESFPEVRRVLSLTTFLGATPQGEYTEFPLWDEDHQAVTHLLAGAQPPLIGLHPAAREESKRWAIERFIAVGKLLQQQYGGTVVILGGPEEWQTAELVTQAIGEAALNLAGKTSLAGLGAAIAQLTILITNDSGPAHIAYALKIPTVTIFGSTDPAVWGALEEDQSDQPALKVRHRALLHQVPCHPCNSATCTVGYSCLEGITVEHVVENATAIIQCKA